MKKRDAIDAVRRLAQSLRSGAADVGSLAPLRNMRTPSKWRRPNPDIRDFEFLGWQFFAVNGPFEDEELNSCGDAKLRAPTGTFIGLAWAATGKLAHRFDFTPSLGPMLYVDVPAPIGAWTDLRPHFESLASALEAELRQHESVR